MLSLDDLLQTIGRASTGIIYRIVMSRISLLSGRQYRLLDPSLFLQRVDEPV